MAFQLKSPAFAQGDPIPRKYTRDGDNLSPPLEWSDPPPKAKSFALVVEDSDAPSGTFHHWGAYDIPADKTRLPEGIGGSAKGDSLGMTRNDFGRTGYDGPEPPPGHGPHHYHFRLMALDVPSLEQDATASVDDLWQAARDHMIAEAELVGTYVR
jgi:Raf kinase inhibitor-like YbhB/YbcL family protein